MDLRKIKRKGKGHGRGKHAKIDSFVWSLEEDIALLSQAQFPASKVSVRDQYGTTAVTRTITNRIEVLKKKSAALREFLTKDLTEVREHVHDLAVKHAEKRRAGDIASETRQDSAFQQQLNTEDATAVRSKRSRNRHKDFYYLKKALPMQRFHTYLRIQTEDRVRCAFLMMAPWTCSFQEVEVKGNRAFLRALLCTRALGARAFRRSGRCLSQWSALNSSRTSICRL